MLDSIQKKWFRDELMRLKKGIQGERESAHYLDSYFKDGKNHVVLHDLRFVIDGDVAQIDHLIINRVLGIYLLETKNYSGDLVINDHGEFTVQYDDARFGIPSPIEQSLRHERLICKLLERLEIVGRTQKQAKFHHVVMLHPKAIIGRPPTKDFDTSNVIKADQFPTWHQRFVDKVGTGTIFKSMLNLRNLETIAEWGEKLKRQHRLADLLALPDFMRPREPSKAGASISTVVEPPSTRNTAPVNQLQSKGPSSVAVSQPSVGPAKRLICASCAAKISFAEGKFCWNNSQRFGGLAYCRGHQSLF